MSFVAISSVAYPESLREDIQHVGLAMLPVARQQPGLISIAFHQSNDKNETMMYWEWESQAHHEACMQSDDWQAIMAAHGAVFSQTGVEFTLQTFERIG